MRSEGSKVTTIHNYILTPNVTADSKGIVPSFTPNTLVTYDKTAVKSTLVQLCFLVSLLLIALLLPFLRYLADPCHCA